jgi:integrase
MEIEKRKRGTGSIIRKSGTSLLYIKYYAADNNGKRVQKEEATGSDDPEVAEKMLRERLVDVSRGMKAKADVLQLRYEDIRDPYLEDHPEVKTVEKAKVAHLNEFFEGQRLTRILESDLIRGYIRQRNSEGVIGSTVKRELGILRAMYYLAQESRMLGSLDIPYFPMPKDSAPRKGFLSADEFEKLRKALPNNIRPVVEFMYYTGCRKGAARKITWEMVNDDCTEIELPGSITKSGEPLVLPLTGALSGLSDTLKDLLKPVEAEENGKKFTFMSPKIGPVFRFTNFRVAWNKACHKAGLGVYEKRLYKGLTPHDLRRSAIRNLIRAGVSESVAMSISGHKTAAVFKRYNITDTKDIHEAMGKVKTYTEEVIQKAKKA